MPTEFLAVIGDAQRTVAVDLFLILAVAGVVAIFMQRLRMAIVPAYLIAGALIGPNVPWSILSDQDSLEQVSHLAIVLLLFGIGLEMDISILKRGLGRMILIGVGSCALTILVGLPTAMLFGLSRPAALTLCMAFSLSSTAVVLRILAARRELRRRSGRLSFSILVIQDIIVLGMLAVLPVVARWDGAGGSGGAGLAAPQEHLSWIDFVADAFLMIGGVAALVVVSKTVLPRILRESLRGRRLEVMMLVGLSAALAAALVAQSIGFSLEMGAFLAGFVLSGTPFRHQLSGQIRPLRDIFSALFFTTVGMKVNPALVAEAWWVILCAVAAVIVIKSVVISGVCWSAGALAANAVIVGLSLAQAGEFSLILIGEAADLAIVGAQLEANAIAVVVISLILTPALADLGRRLGRVATSMGHAPWVRSSIFGGGPEIDTPPEQDFTHVIIGGYGPVGRRIAQELEQAGISYSVIELNPDTVIEQLRQRRSMVFGDVANLRVLESAGIGHADALILTVPDEEAVLRACSVARRRSPALFIAARTGLLSKSRAATDIGADHVIVDEMAAAEAMVRVIMGHLGLDEPDEDEAIEEAMEQEEELEEAAADDPEQEAAPEPDDSAGEPETDTDRTEPAKVG
ncbi:MAG: cation:proton antiporter domain-containing protein [Planctomycetota bacterium]|jgi:CPA2 family monovalent cation:H+ antiporter-2